MREHYSPCVSSTEPAILPFTDLNRLQQIAVEQALRATKDTRVRPHNYWEYIPIL
jgi:hypothetical protein